MAGDDHAGQAHGAEPLGWLLYDGDCGFCSRWAPSWSGYIRRRGYELAPLQDRALQQRFALDETELLKEMTLVLRHGRRVVGADVYRHFLRLSWWLYPVYLLTLAPCLRPAFDWGYRTFARHRHRVTRRCALSPDRT